ncbi:hypothetical protein [Marinibactrum halimedae]|uniref:Uncharacterized protein n=1 Tax=Marinibactrum halimedae TaxID=1444977 RepID=A0AA37T3D6_9GAMM|nr:hypothetical protein [Marinibactrum halimedae]MCD9461343.1 hypothetical protein [Marinibactrum halimedae]GLS24766.1 hypothetical protein GCM10007877_04800 [Marinibactrum halimedae]
MFKDLVKLNVSGAPIKLTALGVSQEECYGFTWEVGQLTFDHSIYVTLVDDNEFALIFHRTSEEAISLYQADGEEVVRLASPSLEHKTLSFAYPQLRKGDRKLFGIVFTDGELDYSAEFDTDSKTFGQVKRISR